MNKAFTLLELVVVIIILGVLATLGFTQYGRMVEKGRSAEALSALGYMRNLAVAYYLANGTVTGITDADLGVGTGVDQLPSYEGGSGCRSSHFFTYRQVHCGGSYCDFYATRCTSGGKAPNSSQYYELILITYLQTGVDEYRSWWAGGEGGRAGW